MTWTATEHVELDWLVINIQDGQANSVCRLTAYGKDTAAIEQMCARARLIVQAEAMRDELMALLDAYVGDKGLEKARAIIKATEGDHG